MFHHHANFLPIYYDEEEHANSFRDEANILPIGAQISQFAPNSNLIGQFDFVRAHIRKFVPNSRPDSLLASTGATTATIPSLRFETRFSLDGYGRYYFLASRSPKSQIHSFWVTATTSLGLSLPLKSLQLLAA